MDKWLIRNATIACTTIFSRETKPAQARQHHTWPVLAIPTACNAKLSNFKPARMNAIVSIAMAGDVPTATRWLPTLKQTPNIPEVNIFQQESYLHSKKEVICCVGKDPNILSRTPNTQTIQRKFNNAKCWIQNERNKWFILISLLPSSNFTQERWTHFSVTSE